MRKLKNLILALVLTLTGGQPAVATGSTSAWDHFKQGTLDTFTGSRKWIWLSGSLLTILAFSYDDDVYTHHIREEDWQPAHFIGDNFGTGIPGGVIALGSLWYGSQFDDEHMWQSGLVHAEALISAFLLTTVLKGSVARPRPQAYRGDQYAFNSSFPSGHTSTAFASAASLWAMHGAWIGAPMMVLASLTGYSRIQRGAHYLSDTIFGATLGMAVGFGFAQHHLPASANQARILPYFHDRNEFGILAEWNWN